MNETTHQKEGDQGRYDVLQYTDGPSRVVPSGDGRKVVVVHEREALRHQLTATLVVTAVTVVVVAAGIVTFLGDIFQGIGIGLLAGIGGGIVRYRFWEGEDMVPDLVVTDASPRVVREYVQDFEPDNVTDPFESDR